VLCSGFGAASVAVSVNRDVTGGAMQRFRSLPTPAACCLVGHVVASVLRNLLATAIVVGVGLLLGGDPGGQAWFALAWCAGIVVVGAVVIAWRFPRR
jgi:ABC-2 type transport system permease protein